MSETRPKETERNLARLRRIGFCAACNAYKDECTNRIPIDDTRWLCENCDQTTLGDFLKGDRR